METMDELYTEQNEYHPEKYGPDNTPEQNFVLEGSRRTEKSEYEQDNKKIINAQRLLNKITGRKLKSELLT
jgi:hypothetical protein